MVIVRTVRRPPRRLLFRLLAVLDDKYPDGLAWLDRRLSDVECGRARLWSAMSGRRWAGVAIETLKGRDQVKLSTFLVDPAFRGCGIGSRLLEEIEGRWSRESVDLAYVSVDERDSSTILFFLARGFQRLPEARAIYGADRADIILGLRPGARLVRSGDESRLDLGPAGLPNRRRYLPG